MAEPRRGSVLITVTVVLLMVSLAVVGLLSMVRLDYQATKMRSRELMMENAIEIAESHVLAVAQLTREQRYAGENLSRSADLFANQPIHQDREVDGQILFSVLIPGDSTEANRFGLVNESTKINLHQLLEWDRQTPGAGERALLELPGMQPEQAASIMDWLDSDSLPRLQGGERDQYVTEQRIGGPANEVPGQLEMLVQVRQTRIQDWFSESPTAADKFNGPEGSGNQAPSGRRSTRSSSSSANQRVTDGVGRLESSSQEHRPWEHYLTIHSSERNESFNGRPRIDINAADLVRLHSELSTRVSNAVADFVVLYRQFGPGRGGRRTPLADAVVDFTLPGKFKFSSELDLVGATVTLPGGRTAWQRFDSPLGSNRSGWAGQLEYLMDQITVDPRPVIEGRINIDEAPREVLLAIPGMDPATADRILAARFLSADGRMAHVHPTWILEQGVVDLARMKPLLKYCTTGGDVFQADIIAYIPQSAWFVREIVAIDGARKPPVKLYCKDRRDSPNPYELDQ